MSYNIAILALLGLFGIVIHNLVKLNEINKKTSGNVSFLAYFKEERFTILLSLCVVAVALIVQQEIKQLEEVGKWLGLSFVAIGYMSQSLVVSFMGKTQKILDSES